MRMRLASAVVAVLLVGADHPAVDLGETRQEIPPDSRWELVQGWRGGSQVVDASVTFYGILMVGWKVGRGEEPLDALLLGTQLDHRSHRLLLEDRGFARMVEGRLEVRLRLDHGGDLHLILKRVK
jgi:hypothetical protein